MQCSQCDRSSVAAVGGVGPQLCVDHFLKYTQALYLEQNMLAATHNVLVDHITQSTGVPTPRMEILRPPFVGDNLTLNNINVANSTFGAINTGTIKDLDVSISLMQGQGKDEIAAAIQELTEAILRNNELDEAAKNEMAEQLAFVTTQVIVEPRNRNMGVVKSILAGVRNSISATAGLLAIWEKLEPLFRSAFGI